jgi:hypothetical protein
MVVTLLSCRMSAAGISGASRKAGFGEGTPQQVFPRGANERKANFGTVVEYLLSVTANFLSLPSATFLENCNHKSLFLFFCYY